MTPRSVFTIAARARPARAAPAGRARRLLFGLRQERSAISKFALINMGWALVAVLTAYAACSALGVTVRARPTGRAETALAFLVLFAALIVAPIFLLGYTGLLWRGSLAATSLVVCSLAFVASAHGRSL